MARAIDADAVISYASNKKMTEIFPNFTELSSETRNALGVFGQYWKTLLEDAPTIELKREWISVKDRLPDSNYGSVLIYTKDGGVAEGQYYDTIKAWLQFRWSVEDAEVTHWMPLPEPPEKEK